MLPPVEEPRPALAAPGLKVNVTAFKISGNTLFGGEVLQATIKDFVGKEQNIDGLNDAATKVRAYYRERGYFLVQAYLPQQEIRGGVVEIAVIESKFGRVAVNFKEGTRFSETMVRGIVEKHLQSGDIITEKGLETPLLLLNDFPNAVVVSEIKPSQTVGAADLVVNVSTTGAPISGSVDIDNAGNRFTGAYRAGVSFNLNNPFAVGDQFSYRAFTTDEQMSFYRMAYVVPVGYWGTRVGASYATFHYQLGRDFLNLQSHGVGSVMTAYAFHPFIRTRSSNLIAQYAYETKSLDDRTDTASTIEDRRINSSKLGFVGDARDGFLGGGLNSFSYTVTEGNVQIGPTKVRDADALASGRKTHGRFAKQNFEFRRLQKITDNATLLFAIQGQLASKNMASAEKFSLGGASGVRAYPTGEALGDTGYLFQVEGRYLVPGFKIAGADLTVSGFYDQGWVKIDENKPATDTGVNNRNINGYGFGASIGKDADFILRASAAWRIEGERPLADTSHRIPRVWVQAIKWF